MSALDAWLPDGRRRKREDPPPAPPERRDLASEIALLQRSAGNHAVARPLAGTRPSGAVLQRENGDDDEQVQPGRQQQLQMLVPRKAAAPVRGRGRGCPPFRGATRPTAGSSRSTPRRCSDGRRRGLG
jgi:hypothetical protein